MAKVTQTKDKDFDAIEPRVNFNDMPEERFTKIVQACRDAYSKFIILLGMIPIEITFAIMRFLFLNDLMLFEFES